MTRTVRDAHDAATATADEFLRRAYEAFVRADYHPFNGIEVEIRAAFRADLGTKVKLLQRLPAMLSKSDYEAVRELGKTIGRKY